MITDSAAKSIYSTYSLGETFLNYGDHATLHQKFESAEALRALLDKEEYVGISIQTAERGVVGRIRKSRCCVVVQAIVPDSWTTVTMTKRVWVEANNAMEPSEEWVVFQRASISRIFYSHPITMGGVLSELYHNEFSAISNCRGDTLTYGGNGQLQLVCGSVATLFENAVEVVDATS